VTVQTEISRSGPYAGSGTTGPFTVGFRFLANSHLQVIRTLVSGLDVTMALTTDYIVSGAGGSSGSVTLVAALASGERLTVVRDVPFTQLADYVENDAFPAESHENALDLLTMQTQQLDEISARSLTLPATVAGVSTELPSPEAGKVIGWNADGTELQNLDASTLASIVAYGTAVSNLFSGDGVQTSFVLSDNPSSVNNLDVSVGGVAQRPGIDYFWTAGTTLTFAVAPVVGVSNVLARYMQALAFGTGVAEDIGYTGPNSEATNVQALAGPAGASLVGLGVGKTVADLSGSDGASLVGYMPAGVGAVETTVQAVLHETVSAKRFGAIGNSNGTSGNGADDTSAIQAALDYVGGLGGGTVKLPKTIGGYRITSLLRIPSYVTLEGVAPNRFPFQNASSASGLITDFSSANQWVVEPKTQVGGSYVAYNHLINNADFATATLTYNCGVKNLQINVASGSVVPFGAVRMHGCPGSVVENVSAVGTGAGLLVNYCFGGSYSFHGLTLYYGTVIWSNANANNFEVYCTQQTYLNTVPAGYVMPFMSSLNGTMVASKLTTEAHYNRSWGLIVGGTSTDQSANNKIDVTIEEFGGSTFQYYGYGNVFNKFYLECAAGHTGFGVVAAYSMFTTSSFHCYLSGTGVYFDLGTTVQAKMDIIGLRGAASYGTGPFLDGTSSVVFSGVQSSFGPAIPQWNISYTAWDQNWQTPTLTNSWANVGGGNQTAQYRINSRTGNVELGGLITGGTSGVAAFTLPAGFRPYLNQAFGTQGGGTVVVSSAGSVIVTPVGASIWLSGISFQSLL